MNANIITISPDIQSGVPVKNFMDYLKAGDTIEEFLEDFPSVQKWQVLGLLLNKN